LLHLLIDIDFACDFSNKKEMLDEALIRPGRADLSFEFFKATSDQIERMFKVFFPVDEIIKANSLRDDTDSGDEEDEKSIWTDAYIEQLAKLYSAKIPKDFLSTAAVQGEHRLSYISVKICV
jgi:ATP-dependent 26S proteasome regulatory subunit